MGKERLLEACHDCAHPYNKFREAMPTHGKAERNGWHRNRVEIVLMYCRERIVAHANPQPACARAVIYAPPHATGFREYPESPPACLLPLCFTLSCLSSCVLSPRNRPKAYSEYDQMRSTLATTSPTFRLPFNNFRRVLTRDNASDCFVLALQLPVATDHRRPVVSIVVHQPPLTKRYRSRDNFNTTITTSEITFSKSLLTHSRPHWALLVTSRGCCCARQLRASRRRAITTTPAKTHATGHRHHPHPPPTSNRSRQHHEAIAANLTPSSSAPDSKLHQNSNHA